MSKFTRMTVPAALVALSLVATDGRSQAAPVAMCGLLPAVDTVNNPPPKQAPGTLTTFEAGTLIIPVDGCYARTNFMNNKDIESIFGKKPKDMICNPDSATPRPSLSAGWRRSTAATSRPWDGSGRSISGTPPRPTGGRLSQAWSTNWAPPRSWES